VAVTSAELMPFAWYFFLLQIIIYSYLRYYVLFIIQNFTLYLYFNKIANFKITLFNNF
jgi:hypothetical protein